MPAAEAGLQRGTLVMQPADSRFSRNEFTPPGRRGDRGGLETFFHKIVIIRNNLRVLEQKVNASDKLSEADKFDLQRYITRCYGSLTKFNILFKTRTTSFEAEPRAARWQAERLRLYPQSAIRNPRSC